MSAFQIADFDYTLGSKERQFNAGTKYKRLS